MCRMSCILWILDNQRCQLSSSWENHPLHHLRFLLSFYQSPHQKYLQKTVYCEYWTTIDANCRAEKTFFIIILVFCYLCYLYLILSYLYIVNIGQRCQLSSSENHLLLHHPRVFVIHPHLKLLFSLKINHHQQILLSWPIIYKMLTLS